ncbi:MAG TPA: ATP-dependent DNA ligase [Blastocatellia bacterium]|nr:ATP-dependent DNA ligase [Blastocatellia bacterium]
MCDPSLENPAAFIRYARTAEAVAATTRRNEKSAILGEYFASLADAELAIAARFFSGSIFPLWDQRTTNIGGAGLLNAMTAVTGVERADLTARLVGLGDLGDLAFEFFSVRSNQPAQALTLREVYSSFEGIAAASGSKIKTTMLSELLSRADALEAKYVVKLLAGDLRIGLKEGSVEDAIARLAGAKIGEVQWANMLTGDTGETAVLARHNQLSQARMRLFHPIKFMLATPAASLEDVARQMPDQFFVEDKFDGIRTQAHISPLGTSASSVPAAAPDEPKTTAHGTAENGARVALFSRTLDEITRSFPELVAPLAALSTAGSGLVFDGEIVPFKDGRILPFLDLQKRLGRKSLPDELLKEVPVAYIVFDILYGKESVLINESLETRRALLESLVMNDPRVQRTDAKRFEGIAELDPEFAASRARGNEGLMVKSPASQYKPGRRGRDWLKIKRAMATLDVVVTAVEVGHGRRSRLLSDYTFAVRASEDEPTLLNVGKAYSGLTDQELEEMSQWFREHTLKEFAQGRVRIVEPKIVLEVTFDLIQKSNRHKSGYALRFPRIVRLRPDKSAAEIDTIETVRRLAEQGSVSEQPK